MCSKKKHNYYTTQIVRHSIYALQKKPAAILGSWAFDIYNTAAILKFSTTKELHYKRGLLAKWAITDVKRSVESHLNFSKVACARLSWNVICISASSYGALKKEPRKLFHSKQCYFSHFSKENSAREVSITAIHPKVLPFSNGIFAFNCAAFVERSGR